MNIKALYYINKINAYPQYFIEYTTNSKGRFILEWFNVRDGVTYDDGTLREYKDLYKHESKDIKNSLVLKYEVRSNE